MFTVIITMTRPSTSSPWWLDSPSLVNEGNVMKESQGDPLVLALSEVESPDGLTLTRNFTYNTYNDYQTWVDKIVQANPAVLTARNEYIIDNGHTLKIEESLDGSAPVIEKQL